MVSVTVALLFFAKLSGLVAFVANVAAFSMLDVLKRRRLTSSILTMWGGSAVAAVLVLVFWVARGPTPLSGSVYAFTWPVIWFPLAAAAFSGFSVYNLLDQPIFLRYPAPVQFVEAVLGPLAILLMGCVWFRLRNTRYRPMATCFFAIIVFYIMTFLAMYVRSGTFVPFEERYFRYAGILFFLLLLVAIDQWRVTLARVVPILIVGMFTVYGLTVYVHELMRGRNYDQVSGTSMALVPPSLSSTFVQRWHCITGVMQSPSCPTQRPPSDYRASASF